MKPILNFAVVLFIASVAVSQEPAISSEKIGSRKLALGAGMGLAGAYTDKTFQWSAPISIYLDYLMVPISLGYAYYFRK